MPPEDPNAPPPGRSPGKAPAPSPPREEPQPIVLAPYEGPVSAKAARAFARSARKGPRDLRRFAPFVATLAIVLCLLLLAAAALFLFRMRG